MNSEQSCKQCSICGALRCLRKWSSPEVTAIVGGRLMSRVPSHKRRYGLLDQFLNLQKSIFYYPCATKDKCSSPLLLKKSLVQTLAFPYFDYADILLTDLSSDNKMKLQRAHNLCVRFVSDVRKYDHITPSLEAIEIRRSGRLANFRGYVAVVINYSREGTTAVLEFSVIQSVSQSKQASQANRSSTRVCVRICVSNRRPEFECSGSQLEGPEFECSGPQLEGPEFEYSELSLKMSIQTSRSMTSSGDTRAPPASCSTLTLKKRKRRKCSEKALLRRLVLSVSWKFREKKVFGEDKTRAVAGGNWDILLVTEAVMNLRLPNTLHSGGLRSLLPAGQQVARRRQVLRHSRPAGRARPVRTVFIA
ncbi:hypothetical protein ANN_02012 [Periplaneta americana]|uniref:Uncharacterized protein n=1 Tax=Periplaneta americana TaxID=6978 RepID=A0ABQ8TY31_PERAM|nr:hypothetical protein ANN_02012 [Periplaneta americana]